MILDHIGFFLYPDVLRLRLIGRIAFPLFFLLIGRNRSSKIGLSLITAACIVQGALRSLSIIKGLNLWQLNILPAAIITKITIERLVKLGNNTFIRLFANGSIQGDIFKKVLGYIGRLFILIVCVVFAPYLKDYIDYGSMILSMAIAGRMIRQYHWSLIPLPLIICFIGLVQINNSFPFSIGQRKLVYIIRIIVMLLVIMMSSNNKTMRFGNSINNLILFLSKHAVWVYVIHFIFLIGLLLSRQL